MAYPNRIDFVVLADEVLVNEFERRGGKDMILPDRHRVVDKPLEEMLAWCEANGYTVRRWDGGARAFFGKPWIIRNGKQVIKARERFYGDGKVHMDFAYDG